MLCNLRNSLVAVLPIFLINMPLLEFMSHPLDGMVHSFFQYICARNLVQSGLSRLNTALDIAAWHSHRIAAGDFSSAAREMRRAINHLLGERIKIDKRAIYTSSETKLCATMRRAYQQKHQSWRSRNLSSIPQRERICKR